MGESLGMKVAYAGTRNLYPWFKPAIRSLLAHNKVDTIYLMIEDDDVPEGLPEANYKVINVSGQTVFDEACPNIDSHFTYMAMMRALYADLIPDEDRIISLDIDTIVCDSLEPIWNMDLTGKWMSAAVEYFGQYNPFKYPCYFNVGVAVFNLDEMRKDSAPKLLTDFLYTHKIMCIEQDALNFYTVIPRKVIELPTRYNESPLTGVTKTPAVVHYAGYKDWTTNKNMPRREYLEMWMDK